MALCQHFLQVVKKQKIDCNNVKGLTQQAVFPLEHNLSLWIRNLENTIPMAVLMADDDLIESAADSKVE